MNRPFTVTARPLRDKNGPTQTFTVHARTAAQARVLFLRQHPELKAVTVRRAGASS